MYIIIKINLMLITIKNFYLFYYQLAELHIIASRSKMCDASKEKIIKKFKIKISLQMRKKLYLFCNFSNVYLYNNKSRNELNRF